MSQSWQKLADSHDTGSAGLALGCSWASRLGPAGAQQTAADTA
eukprot:COSAG06_NODE_38247_length_425_cov_2.036810_1_plen_42_part_10